MMKIKRKLVYDAKYYLRCDNTKCKDCRKKHCYSFKYRRNTKSKSGICNDKFIKHRTGVKTNAYYVTMIVKNNDFVGFLKRVTIKELEQRLDELYPSGYREYGKTFRFRSGCATYENVLIE